MDNLWPDDLEQQAESITPAVSILRYQATLLGERTNHKVEAEVQPVERPLASMGEFQYNFMLIGPLIGNYQYRLFGIAYDIDLYPVTLYLDGEIKAELGFEQRDKVVIGDKHEFTSLLRNVFNSSKTRKVIAGILSQSQ